jgi:hypothetical protein
MQTIARRISVLVLTAAVLFSAQPAAAHPTFTAEPISNFSAALAALRTDPFYHRVGTLDARHSDATQYRAYRFIEPDTVMVGVAKAVTLDSNGHVHFVQEPGAPMIGRPNPTHAEYSHILVPIRVTPP